MKFLASTLLLCTLVCGVSLAQQDPNKCGCSKPRPVNPPPAPAQVMKPAPAKSACAPACADPAQKACDMKPKA